MKKGLWKRRAFAFLVAAAMVIPQGVYAAGTEGNETSENAITEEVLERVHENGCTLPSDHEGDCVITPAENTEEPTERVHEEGCTLAPDHEGDCVTEPERVHEDGCTLDPDHEGDCVTEPAESTEEQPERVHEDGCVLPSDHEGECEVAEQEEAMLLGEPNEAEMIYVSSAGMDDGDGTTDNPYSYHALVTRLEKESGKSIVVNVMSNMEVDESLKFWGLDVTIQSYPETEQFTITRADDFKTTQDLQQGGYNGAMIEVNGSLTLKNLILDDDFKYEGTIFSQTVPANSEEYKEHPNEERVQHAIIGTWDDHAVISLDEGAILKNYGGMSAARISGGTLIMNSGSAIYDEGTRNVQKGGGTGPAGAVWLQNGTFIMDENAEIRDMVGRAVYADLESNVTIDGSISGITNNKNVWGEDRGVAIHVRGGSTATLNGTVSNISKNSSNALYNVAIFVEGSKFYMNNGAVIKNCTGMTAINGYGKLEGYILMAGKITGNTGGQALNINADNWDSKNHLTCDLTGEISGNTYNGAAGIIYMQGRGSVLNLYGKIKDNIGSGHIGLWIGSGYDGTEVNMYDGAEIVNNRSNTAWASGLTIAKGTFNMYGGTISGNYTGTGGSGVTIGASGVFNMMDGTISDNVTQSATCGVKFDSVYNTEAINKGYETNPPVANLMGGTISGNIANATITWDEAAKEYVVTGGQSNDIALVQGSMTATDKNALSYGDVNRYMTISDKMVIGNPDIYLEKYNVKEEVDEKGKVKYVPDYHGVVLKNPADSNVKFGNASPNAVQTLRDASQAKGWYPQELASLWCQNKKGTMELLIGKHDMARPDLPIYAAVIPTDETGDALTETSVAFYNVTEKSDKLYVAFPAPSENGYAVALVHPTEDYGTMNITAPNTVTMEDGAVIDYTVTYEMSENLANVLASGKNLKNITMNVRFDKNVSIDPTQIKLISDMFDMVNATYSGNTLTVTCSMKDGWQNAASKNVTLKFAADANALSVNEVVTASGDFNGEIERDDSSPVIVFVPANAVQTEVVTNASCVTVKLADLIVYMGGEQGFENVVDNENGHVTASESLPEPGFVFELPDEISSAGEIEFVEETSGKTWKAVPYDGESTRVYKLESGIDQDPVRVEFTKDDGTKVVSDEFKVGDALNQKLHMAIYKGAVGTVVAKVGNDTYPVISQDATLEVRGTTNQVKYADVSTNPALQVGEPALKADSNTTFTINEGDVLASKNGVALLFDNIIENTASENNRTELLKDRAETELKNSYNECAFDLKYLDLVDRHNGNTWVKASEDVTVYWPYPEGTDKTTDFELLHFEDLHRDMSNNEVAGDIASCKVSPVKFTKLDDHIEFKIGSGGFSPFALVWEGKESDGGSSSGGGHTSNTYYVRYHNDDETEKDGKFIPGETVTVKGNVFTAPVGKALAGWSLEEDGKVDYKVGDTFRMPGSSVDLYAVWKDAETESHSAYISGYPDGTVGPDKTITRAEAATMFYNLLADKTGDAKTFTDIPANQWYAKAVMTLAGKGVISGYPDGTFKPDASITRAEFVTMAMNFANAEKGTACSFPDVPQNMWYYGAIAGATQNGWISGYPDGIFGPDRYITRAEVTSVINRMENRAADMSFMMDHLDELRTFSDLSFGHWAYGSMMEAANGHDYTRADQNSYESWVDIH